MVLSNRIQTKWKRNGCIRPDKYGPESVWEVIKELKKIESVEIARAVSGRYNVVVYVVSDSLAEALIEIKNVEGIREQEILVG